MSKRGKNKNKWRAMKQLNFRDRDDKKKWGNSS